MDGIEKLTKLYNITPNVLFNGEDFLAYQPSRLHPVALGDTSKDGRYEGFNKHKPR